jgi:hypothetical protein
MFAPTLVPQSHQTAFIVEDDVGKFGRVFSETDVARADRETTLNNLYTHQYHDPVRVIAFNTQEGWSRDVSSDFAFELLRRADLEGEELSGKLAEFVEFYTRRERQLSLRLA